MRKLLLWMATMCVGGATLMIGMLMLTGDGSVFFAGVVLWLLALAIGLALSAPAFLDPPDDGGGVWSFRVPLPLWLFLTLMKLTSWVGFMVLLGSWMLIFQFWNSRNSGRRPQFSGAAGAQPSNPQQYVPQQPSLPPASWQSDPTGRFLRRYWDGTRWTDQVTTGTAFAVDPL
jgi:hypothetical protein